MTGRFEFWVEYAKRVLVGLGLFLGLVLILHAAPAEGRWTPSAGPGAVRVTEVDRSTIQYSDGAWHANGRPVLIECPTEDACQTQIVGSVLWVVRVAS